MIKKLFLTVGLLIALANWAVSEEPKASPQVKTIFDYKQELNLSPTQVEKIKDCINELNNSVKVSRQELANLEKSYQELVANDKTTMAQAKAKLQEIADVTIKMRLHDLSIARKITATLTDEQHTQLKAILAKAKN